MAGPLLLKCNHSNLLLWFPIERISHVSVQRRISSLLQSEFGISLFILKCSCRRTGVAASWLPHLPYHGLYRGAARHLRSPAKPSHERLDRSALRCLSTWDCSFLEARVAKLPTGIEIADPSRLPDGGISKPEQRS